MPEPRLSLCLIVRNEQEMLPDLLASVTGLWDELVVADTGSTDGTVALLEAAGARILHHPWADDFAAARNAGLAVARGRWILFLDADERVSPALRDQIRQLLDDNGAGAATVVMRNALPGGDHRDADLLRLFRRDRSIRFRHRIHEDVLPDVEAYLARTGLALRHLDGIVTHLGYARATAADRNKQQRDQDLLRLVLAEDPTDFYCWFKLLESARFWEDRQLWAAVSAEVAPLLTGAAGQEQQRELLRNPWSGELAALISQGLHDDPAAALAWLDRWADRVRPGAAWHLRRGRLLEDLSRDEEAAAAFAACRADRGPGGRRLQVRAGLGECRLAARAGDLPRAAALAVTALATAPEDREALLAAVTFTGLGRGQQAVAEFAFAHARMHPQAGGVVAEVLLEAGHLGPAAELLAELSPTDPALALGLVTCTLALGRDLDLDIDIDREAADTAFRHWIRILWNSRRTEAMTVFAENSGSVREVFPWLEDYLVAETARLRG